MVWRIASVITKEHWRHYKTRERASTVARILVTGSLGTVGSPLTAELVARGHDVYGCDIRHGHQEQYYRCDVGCYRQVAELFDQLGHIDLVYHTAAEFGRANGEAYFEQLWTSNVIGTKNMLCLQRQRKFRMVFFSSSEVYGDFSSTMFESVPTLYPVRQLNDYAISKWVSELQVLNDSERYDLENVRVRLFNTYGPGEYFTPYRSVIAKFCYHALHQKPYRVYRNHERSFCYIADAVRTLANIADCFHPGEVYNIGSTKTYSMKEVSDLVLQATGADPCIVQYYDEEPMTTQQKRVSVVRAKQHLGHRTIVSLERGIQHTVDWMRGVYGISSKLGEARERAISHQAECTLSDLQ
jgi:dTDP-glucose 4,6-dehydratase